jgi:poly(3-hydroxybutyrate) depolymerase
MLSKTLKAFGLLALAGLASAAKPSAGCGKTNTLKEGNHTLTVNGTERWYLLKLPANYDNKHPYRLIFTLHAAGGNSSMVADGVGGYLPWYGLPDLVKDDVGAIYVNPNGLNRGWANTGGADAALMKSIIDAAKADLCVDENLVFSVGFSYGASMSYALACALAKDFRAVGVQSGGNMSGCATGEAREPVAFYGQHGVDGDLSLPGARKIRDQFVKLNGCTPQADNPPAKGSGTHTKTEYKGCREGFPVTWIEYDGGHTPRPTDKGAAKTFAADETWAFFSQFK